MSIARKLWIGFGIVILVLAVSTPIIIDGINRAYQELHDITTTEEPAKAAAYEMEINITEAGLRVMKYLETGDPQSRQLAQQDEAEYRKFLAAYDRLSTSAEDQKLGIELDRRFQEYWALGNLMMDRRDQIDRLSQEIAQNFEKLDEILDDRIEPQIDRAAPDGLSKLDQAALAESEIAEVGVWLGNYLRIRRPEYLERIYDNAKDFRLPVAQLRRLRLTSYERRWINELEKLFEITFSLIEKALRLDELQEQQAARFLDLRLAMDQLLDGQIQVRASEDLTSASQAAQQAARNIRILLVAVLAVVLIEGATVLIVVRGVARSVRKLVKGVNRVGAGDLDHRIDIQSRDEVGEVATAFNRMAAKRQEAERALQESKDRYFQSLIANTNDIIAILDSGGRVRYQSPSTQKVMGWSAAELDGQRISEWIHPEDVTHVERVFNDVVSQGGFTPSVAFRIRARDGSWKSLEATGHNLLAEPAIAGVVINSRDVTEQRLAEAAQARLQESLMKSEKLSAMGTLVAGVAHEVRNPLFGISSLIDALEARFQTQRQFDPYIALLRDAVDRLNRLMGELLDYGKPHTLGLTENSLHGVLTKAIEACTPKAQQAKVSIDNRVRQALEPIMLDPARMRQVFQNLIENALHYSPPNATITIDAVEVAQGDQLWVECSVQDAGPGFQTEDLSRVFEPFFTTRRGGTGLGLSVVQRIVEEHGGLISAANRPGGGAVLTVKLPRSISATPSAMAPPKVRTVQQEASNAAAHGSYS